MHVYQGDFSIRNWERLRRVRKPVIAVVAGFAMGGGCKLALAYGHMMMFQKGRHRSQ